MAGRTADLLNCIHRCFLCAGVTAAHLMVVQEESRWWERLGEQEWAATDEALLAPDVVPGGM